MRKTHRSLGSRMVLVSAFVALTTLFLGVPAAWAAAPTITSFTPTSGPVGTVVTITGTGFNDLGSVVNDVEFNNLNAGTFVVNSDTSISATVPTGATDGLIDVSDPEGTATSATIFDVTTGTAPTVTSFTPTSGPVGTVVTITGTGFTGATAVRFNGVAATTFTVNSATQITATVPTGATTGPISVTTPSGTGTSATNFTVTVVPVVHGRSVTLNLTRHLRARGVVSSDFAACESGASVRVQRKRPTGWRTVGTDTTSSSGQYAVGIPDREGKYRALASRTTLSASDICAKARSSTQRHFH